MSQNDRIAVLIPMYRKFIDDERAKQVKAAAKLAPKKSVDVAQEEVSEHDEKSHESEKFEEEKVAEIDDEKESADGPKTVV